MSHILYIIYYIDIRKNNFRPQGYMLKRFYLNIFRIYSQSNFIRESIYTYEIITTEFLP